jgi:predicted MFS family arabinose efflux permease
MEDKPRNNRLFWIFFILSCLYIFSMFHRVTNAVIAPNLIQDLKLNPETLGFLGGAFFYAFALMQFPIGPMLDRIGPRWTITCLAFGGALGALIFATAQSFAIALVGRILIGVGMSAVWVGALKVFTMRFPSEKFATWMGILVSIGTLGNILAASPLAYFTSQIGWRMTLIITGGITALLAFLNFWLLKGGEKGEGISSLATQPTTEVGLLQPIKKVLKSLTFWKIGAVSFVRYGTFVGLQGLWLGPYLISIKGYSPVQAGNLLILLAVGMCVGSPISGQISDRIQNPRKTAFWGLSLYGLTLIPLLGVIEIQNPFWFALIFFWMGFFNVFGTLVFDYKGCFLPKCRER